MKKIIVILLSPLFLLFLAEATRPADPPAELPESDSHESYSRKRDERLESSIVLVAVRNGKEHRQGSGFVAADGYLVTKGELVADAARSKNARVTIIGKAVPEREAEVESVSRPKLRGKPGGADLALLKFVPPAGSRIPEAVFNLEVRNLDEVYAWGYPLSVPGEDDPYRCVREENCSPPPRPLRTSGAVNSLFTLRGTPPPGGINAVSHGAQMDKGLYGGPLVNYAGEVVGVNFDVITEPGDAAAFSLAWPSRLAVEFLRENGVEPRLTPPGKTLPEDAPFPGGGRSRNQSAGKRDRLPPEKRLEGEGPAFRPEADPASGDPSRIRDLGSFRVEIPEDWSVLAEAEDAVFMGREDGAAYMGILSAENRGMDLRRVAEIYRGAARGGGIRKSPEAEIYRFAFRSNGKEAVGFVFSADEAGSDRHFVIYVEGNRTDPGVDFVLDSLKDLNG
ncbi:MAG: serine protease [Deltaproteobacteria bacterium]|jgi:hypothetical protein|nr:serine protease [Deltaproteobacteria bacterium]